MPSDLHTTSRLITILQAEFGSAFYDVRKNADGTDKPHPLNDPRFKGASILLSGTNFGCGSSREPRPSTDRSKLL